MKTLRFLLSLLFLLAICLLVSFYVKADLSSVNSGGGTTIVVNPDRYINSFITGRPSPAPAPTPTPTPSPGGRGGGASSAQNILVSPLQFNIDLSINTNAKGVISIKNYGTSSTTVAISQSNLTGLVILGNSSITLASGETQNVSVTFVAPNKTGTYTGTIMVGNTNILVTINVKSVLLLFDSRIVVLNKNSVVLQGDPLQTQITIIPMGDHVRTDVTLNYQIKDYSGKVYQTQSETMLVDSLKTISRNFDTRTLPPGDYIIGLQLVYPHGVAPSSAQFQVISKNYSQRLLGYLILFLIIAILFILILIVLILMIRIIRRIRAERRWARMSQGLHKANL